VRDFCPAGSSLFLLALLPPVAGPAGAAGACCDRGRRSRRRPMTRDDDSEELAFAAAHRHAPKVARTVVVGSWPPLDQRRRRCAWKAHRAS
jgi:hypothetical protein